MAFEKIIIFSQVFETGKESAFTRQRLRLFMAPEGKF
jgi:hypothetical protein